MPAISRGSGTRSRRRQPSEDNIEDGDPTQRSRTEDVEDVEDARSTRVSRTLSKASKPDRTRGGRTKSNRPKDGNGDASDNEDQKPELGLGIDINNFQDQPLSKADARKVAALSQDWEQIKRNMRSATLPLVESVAVAMAEAGENKDGEEALKELEESDTLMRDLLDLQAELQAHEDTLNTLSNGIARGEAINNIQQRYTDGVDYAKEAWQNRTTRQKYAKDEDYVRFKSSIYEVQHPDQGMPPLTDFIPSEEGDESDDDDIAVGGVSQVYTCPLTLRVLESPMTSKICKHSFSKASIIDYFSSNRSLKKKCPAAGCSELQGLSDFAPNPDLERKVKAHVRREQRRQAEADSEEEQVEEIID